jgi:hypothetical protein
MKDASFIIILFGILAMIIASVLIYLDTLHVIAYALYGTGFIAIGIGLLYGLFSMVSDEK